MENKILTNHENGNDTNRSLAVRCIHKHQDGLTKGKIYSAVAESVNYYDIQPDDYGHLSGFDKRYFEVVSNDR